MGVIVDRLVGTRLIALPVTKAKSVGILVVTGHSVRVATISSLRTAAKNTPIVHLAIRVALAGHTIVDKGSPTGAVFTRINAKYPRTRATEVTIGITGAMTVLSAIEHTSPLRVATRFARVVMHALNCVAQAMALISLVGVPTSVAGLASALPCAQVHGLAALCVTDINGVWVSVALRRLFAFGWRCLIAM